MKSIWQRLVRADRKLKIRRTISLLLYLCSEIEAHVNVHGERIRFRDRYLRWNGVTFSRRYFIGRNFQLWGGRFLSFGERLSLGENTGIYGHAPITIGDDFTAAPGLTINSGTHDVTTLEPRGEAIRIGDRVWCGVNVTILAGVEIGDDVVIGANSLVMHSIEANTLAAGQPAKPIKKIDRAGKTIWRWT